MVKEKAKEPEVEAVEDKKPRSSGWGGKLIWGALLVAVGVVLLLDNLGVVKIDILALWKLWPLLIVVTGLSILSLRGWLAGLIYGLTAVAIAVLTWVVLTGGVSVDETSVTDNFSINQSNSAVEQLDLTINSGAGSLKLGSHSGSDIVKGELRDSNARLKQSSSVDGNRQIVDMSLERDWAFIGGSGRGRFDVNVGRRIPANIHIKSGASSIDADLSSVALKSLNIDSGASSIDVKLGDKLDESKVDIDTGVSSVDLLVPSSAGVRLDFDGGLSSRHLPSGFEDAGNSVYQSPDYDRAEKKIIINVDMGVSSFKLSTY